MSCRISKILTVKRLYRERTNHVTTHGGPLKIMYTITFTVINKHSLTMIRSSWGLRLWSRRVSMSLGKVLRAPWLLLLSKHNEEHRFDRLIIINYCLVQLAVVPVKDNLHTQWVQIPVNLVQLKKTHRIVARRARQNFIESSHIADITQDHFWYEHDSVRKIWVAGRSETLFILSYWQLYRNILVRCRWGVYTLSETWRKTQ